MVGRVRGDGAGGIIGQRAGMLLNQLGREVRELQEREAGVMEGEQAAAKLVEAGRSLVEEGRRHFERGLFKHQVNRENMQTHFAFLRHRVAGVRRKDSSD